MVKAYCFLGASLGIFFFVAALAWGTSLVTDAVSDGAAVDFLGASLGIFLGAAAGLDLDDSLSVTSVIRGFCLEADSISLGSLGGSLGAVRTFQAGLILGAPD